MMNHMRRLLTVFLLLVLAMPIVSADEEVLRPTIIYSKPPADLQPFNYQIIFYNTADYQALFEINLESGQNWTSMPFPIRQVVIPVSLGGPAEYVVRLPMTPSGAEPFTINSSIYMMTGSSNELLHTGRMSLIVEGDGVVFNERPLQVVERPYEYGLIEWFLSSDYVWAAIMVAALILIFVLYRKEYRRKYYAGRFRRR